MKSTSFKGIRQWCVVGLVIAAAAAGACTKTNTTTAPTPAPTPATLSAPTPVTPGGGTSSIGWPTLTTQNASRTGTTAAITYRFEVATNASFAPVAATATVPEGSGQTSYRPDVSLSVVPQGPVYWRVTAIDQTNNLTSSPSQVMQFRLLAPTDQNRIAVAQGTVIWPGIVPVGTYGHASMGPGWDPGTDVSFDGVSHQVPTIDELRVFDLLDIGLDPDGALSWLRANGYGTAGVYYSSVQAIGFPFEYMALINGQWKLVRRVGA